MAAAHRCSPRSHYVHYNLRVVTPPSPRPTAPPHGAQLPHILQLDGVDDGDKGPGGQDGGAAPTQHLPSDIMEFVLHNMEGNKGAPNGDGAPYGAPNGDGAPYGAPNGDGASYGAPSGDGASYGAPNGDGASYGAPNGDGASYGAPNGDGAPYGDREPIGDRAPNGDGAWREMGGDGGDLLMAPRGTRGGGGWGGEEWGTHWGDGGWDHGGGGTHQDGAHGGGTQSHSDVTWGDVTWNHISDGHQHGGSQHGGSQHGVTQHGATHHGATQHGVTQHGGTHHGATQHGGSQHGGSQHGATQHGVAHHGVPHHPGVSPTSEGPLKRHVELPGPGGKRARLEDNDNGHIPMQPLGPDLKEEPDELSDSAGSPPGCSPPPSDGAVEPPWAVCAGGSSDDEVPPPQRPPPGCSPPPPGRPQLRFEISSDDGLRVCANSIHEAWRAVMEKVEEARAHARMAQLSFTGMSGLRLLGMQHEAVLFLVEQLPGAGSCGSYRFRYHPRGEPQRPAPRNPSGCARAELYVRKVTLDMFSFLASQHRALPEGRPPHDEEDDAQLKHTRRATSLELPMAMRFRHLKRTAKEAVGVYRSAIHGRGLFCKRNIDAGEMVIEYSGIVVRSVLTDKREKYYDSKGIGCYMFRIDDLEVVDATMHGSAARFINHSCEPNCYSRVIHVDGHKRIVIFALRRILRGEELTYDYKFPIEPSNKLPCNCGARRCRRFLN